MKKICALLLVTLMLTFTASCSPDIDPETQSLIDELPVIDSAKLPYNVEELINRADNTGKITKYTIGYSFDTDIENKTIILSNDGVNNCRKQEIVNAIVTNQEDGSTSLTFKSMTESYYSHENKTLYVQKNNGNEVEYVGEAHEYKVQPSELSIKEFLEQEIGPGFWDAFLSSFVTAKYDAINDSYLLDDFSIIVGNETKEFNDVVIKYSGVYLNSFESKTGPQITHIEFNNLHQTTVILPNNKTEVSTNNEISE